jgi:hypothetical protein
MGRIRNSVAVGAVVFAGALVLPAEVYADPSSAASQPASTVATTSGTDTTPAVATTTSADQTTARSTGPTTSAPPDTRTAPTDSTSATPAGPTTSVGSDGPPISDASATQTAGGPPLPPGSSGPSPWLAYASDVDPGSAIQFASPTVGWRVDGQDMAAHVDDHLANGPGGASFTWPGTSISATADGGSTWNVIDTEPNGVWGLDLLSPQVGWIVGVTSLMGTTDGGASWTHLSEPTAPLVTVQFGSPTDGFGLSNNGQLVMTTDGGSSWQSQSSPAGIALCFSSATTGYLADETGDVFQTTDGGATWAKSYTSTVPSQYPQVWSQLSCDASSSVEAINIASPLLRQPAYLVVQHQTGSSQWDVLTTSAGGGQALDPGASSNSPFESINSVTSGNGKTLIAGIPYLGFTAGLSTVQDGSSTVNSPDYPTLPASASLNPLTTSPLEYVHVQGADIQGQTAWAYITDAAVDGTSPTFETIELRSQDSGQSWSTVSNSGQQVQPAYTP